MLSSNTSLMWGFGNKNEEGEIVISQTNHSMGDQNCEEDEFKMDSFHGSIRDSCLSRKSDRVKDCIRPLQMSKTDHFHTFSYLMFSILLLAFTEKNSYLKLGRRHDCSFIIYTILGQSVVI